MKKLGIHISNVFRYKFGFIRGGKTVMVTDWKNNLILDSGLDLMGTNAFASVFQNALLGDQVSPTPTSRNSGSVTFTTVGTTCTASGGFFVAQDVGRLIKFDDTDGQERYITGFTSSTVITLGSAPSPAITAQTASVWYVNQTALESLYSTTTTYSAAGGANGTSWIGDTRTMKRTFTFPAISGAPVTLTEIGFNINTSNSNLFDRDIIVGGIGLIIGDIPLAVTELIQTFSPIVPTSQGNVATGYDSSGQYQLCDAIQELASVNGSGGTTGSGALDANTNSMGNMGLTTVAFSFPAFNTNFAPGGFLGPDALSIAGYTSGSFFRDKTCSFSIAAGNGTIAGIIYITGGAASTSWAYKFTSTFVKSASQSLDLTCRWSWQRILQN